MTDPPVSGIPVDLMGDGDSIDPRQWAMHGLLTVYFRYERSREQASGLQPHGPAERTHAVRPPLRRRTLAWSIAGLLATAALIAVAVLIPRWQGFDLREIGFAVPVLAAGPSIDPGDSEAVDAVSSKVQQNRAERDEALRTGEDPWLPWTQLYRNLRAVGRWDEALEEMHAFEAYAQEQDQWPDRYSVYYVCLSDLGNTYAAIGDYDQAWDYRKQSLAVARDYQEWYLATLGVANDSAAYPQAMTSTLVPRLSALSTLAAAKGDMRVAWEYHNEAGDMLTDYFRRECTDRGLNMSTSATLADLCASVVADGNVPHSLAVKVREHLLREARLHRLDRNLDAAEQTLETAATLPDFPSADESHLDFNEPMERLRIAIARGDFNSALQHADEAAQHTSLREFDGYPTHPPIGTTARAELNLLRGVAGIGLDVTDSTAIRTVASAMHTVDEIAALVPLRTQENFKERFRDWIVPLQHVQ